MSERHFIMSLDPGFHNGIVLMVVGRGWGVHHPIQRLSAFTVDVPVYDGDPPHLTYHFERMGLILLHIWERARRYARDNYCVRPEHHVLVIEDFNLKRSYTSTKKEVLAPVYVTAAFAGARLSAADTREKMGIGPNDTRPAILSQPSTKAMVKGARLRAAGLWVTGDHNRAALAHAIIAGRKLGYSGMLDRLPEKPEPFYPNVGSPN